MCDSHHSTKDHIDGYKHPNTSQDNNPGPSQPKKPFKGKGKQQANTAEQVTSIVMIDSDDEDDTGHTSQTAEIGKQLDDEYAHRLATAPKEEYDPFVKQLDAPIVTNKINPDHIKNIIAPSINT
ncbi:hypothetical protein SCLCIDRAFT_32766 [Scleroderma citrinum Foug A]|uniref:Uncharacterized protein n=1 Tax=Scleroderma citrinum Foug A TaxID=1036808 RepID=A0A0C3D797_9AGAM|nr:hypothetical protein SCLCIDRAFT_32766 [Scleroderma citrinum Foug A]